MKCCNCNKRIGIICRLRKKDHHAILFEGGKMPGRRDFCSDKCSLEMMDKLGLKQSPIPNHFVWTNKVLRERYVNNEVRLKQE